MIQPRGRGAHPPHAGASPARPPGARHTRVHTCAHGAAGAGVRRQAEPHGQGAPRVRSSATRACTSPRSRNGCPRPLLQGNGRNPGVWARVKSRTIFYRLCAYARCEPANNVRPCGRTHGYAQRALQKSVHLHLSAYVCMYTGTYRDTNTRSFRISRRDSSPTSSVFAPSVGDLD